MKLFPFFLLLVLLLAISAGTPAQKTYPKNYFRSPVDYGITLSGSFGEVRKNHFHSGLDIRTGGVTGKPVYAIADGYVQRIFVSPAGFGKALYVVHPNGYTSVYGHLDRFNSRIGKWVKAEQYKKESFEMDITVAPGVLQVKKGEVIAYSGNSGSSGGPHLHFEIRDGGTQEIINPQLFGIPVKDLIPPVIYSVKIFPYGENSLVNYSNRPFSLAVAGSGGKYLVKSQDTVRVTGNIIFGIEAFDFINDNNLRTGITSIELWIDSEKYFSETIERFAFSETRYVNSVIDYPSFIESGKKIQRSYIAPNNKLSIYDMDGSNGLVNFADTRMHKVRYVVKDISGNSSELAFWVKSHPPPPGGRYAKKEPQGILFPCKSPNRYSNDDLVFELPDDALYEDLDFICSASAPLNGSYSGVHHLHNEFTPVHTSCDLSIRAGGLPKNLESRSLIVKIEGPGKYSSRGGKFENGFVSTKVREFGDYTVMADTVKPVIRPVNIFSGKKVGTQGSIRMKISDNLSGIKSYRGTLNGKWILMDYDSKNQLLAYVFDDRIQAGKNEFVLIVRDNVGNESVYRASLIK